MYTPEFLTETVREDLIDDIRMGDRDAARLAFTMDLMMGKSGGTAEAANDLSDYAGHGYRVGYYELGRVAEAAVAEELAYSVDRVLTEAAALEDSTPTTILASLAEQVNRWIGWAGLGRSTDQMSNCLDGIKLEQLQRLFCTVQGI